MSKEQAASEADDSTIYALHTPSDTTRADDDNAMFNDSEFSVPVPGSTFIIRSASDGRVLTLLDGIVVLAPPGGRGAIHWVCVEVKGWLGFKNIVSGKFLGYDKHGKLICTAAEMREWEQFCVRPRADSVFALLMTHWDALWHVGVTVDGGDTKGAKGGRTLFQGQKTGWDAVSIDSRDGLSMDRLAKLAEGSGGGVGWQFVEVPLMSTF